jgi:hypothetical protein
MDMIDIHILYLWLDICYFYYHICYRRRKFFYRLNIGMLDLMVYDEVQERQRDKVKRKFDNTRNQMVNLIKK